jgi:methylmalonyl-CoA/ethylmalonyl-CoA epimerase
MDRPVIDELRERLASGGPGGVIDASEPVSADVLAAVAHAAGARLALLDRPPSKPALIEALQTSLALPAYTGHNWDALEEVLRDPEASGAEPILIVWHDPSRLPGRDRQAFRAVAASVAAARAATGDGALIVIAEATATPQETAMPRVPPSIRALGKVHHVALIVASIETALGFWRDTLGAPLETIMDIPQDRVRIAFLTVGESKIELVEPTDDSTGVARFLASKGEGFHHICFEVTDLSEALTRLGLDGLELIDAAPRKGAEGPVAFIHPRSCHGVLVELIEAPGGPAWRALGFGASAG